MVPSKHCHLLQLLRLGALEAWQLFRVVLRQSLQMLSIHHDAAEQAETSKGIVARTTWAKTHHLQTLTALISIDYLGISPSSFGSMSDVEPPLPPIIVKVFPDLW